MLADKQVKVGGFLLENWVDQIYGTGNGSRTTQTTASLEQLSDVLTGVGDFKRAVAHRYRHVSNNGQKIEELSSTRLPDGRIYSYTKTGDNGTPGTFAGGTDPGSYNQAVSRLADLIRGGVDLSIDTYQHKQTLKLVAKVLSLRKVVEELARRSFRVDGDGAKRRRYSTITRNRVYKTKRNRKDNYKPFRQAATDYPLKRVGALHLEFTYGVKPTLQTIYDIVGGTLDRYGNTINIKSPTSNSNGVTGKVKQDRVIMERDPSTGSFSKTRIRQEWRTKIGGSYTPSDSTIETLSRYSSLNPASIIWENIPFSFVFDWFYDIGGYLRNLETALVSRLGTFEGYVTTTSRETHEVLSAQDFTSGNSHTRKASSETRYDQKMNRVRLTSFPLPRPPRFTTDLGSGRLINAAALLSQFLKTKTR